MPEYETNILLHSFDFFMAFVFVCERKMLLLFLLLVISVALASSQYNNFMHIFFYSNLDCFGFICSIFQTNNILDIQRNLLD